MLITRVIKGGLVGMSLGTGYHFLMKAIGSTCINCQVPAVPILTGLALGVIVGFSSK